MVPVGGGAWVTHGMTKYKSLVKKRDFRVLPADVVESNKTVDWGCGSLWQKGRGQPPTPETGRARPHSRVRVIKSCSNWNNSFFSPSFLSHQLASNGIFNPTSPSIPHPCDFIGERSFATFCNVIMPHQIPLFAEQFINHHTISCGRKLTVTEGTQSADP